MKYIWQHDNWTAFRWQSSLLLEPIGKARLCQGKLLSKARALGIDLGREAQAEILIEETLKTAAIEGETLDRDSVKSSVARHLGRAGCGTSRSGTPCRRFGRSAARRHNALRQAAYCNKIAILAGSALSNGVFRNASNTHGKMAWFLGCFVRAVEHSEKLISTVLAKAEFWQRHSQTIMNERQRKVVNRLLDAGKGGFQGGLTTRKYASLAKVSRATAYREITDLARFGPAPRPVLSFPFGFGICECTDR